ncbi:MAG: tyrosine-type recombinase/integrase [Ilumatobacteraceae bacterium]|nr:tyrosine-type recombinase/integrase [Ilumatobacteraceae bacterium]
MDARAPRTRGNGEGSVYQEGAKRARSLGEDLNGRWVAQVRVEGKYRRTFHPTEAAAKRALKKMVAAVDSGLGIADGNLTLGDLLDRWEAKALAGRDVAPRTAETYRWALGVLSADLGSRRVRKLSADAVEAAFATRASEGMSRASLVKVRSVLGQALDWSMRRGLVGTNVARIVELPAEARRTPPGRALTVDQAKKLVQEAEGDRLHALWLVMLMLGLRPGEATGLSWVDVDLRAGVVHVRRSLKFGVAGTLHVDEQLKTSKSRRSLDAPPAVIVALKAHQQRQTKEKVIASPDWLNEDDLVFTTNVGSPIDPSNLRRSFAKLTTSAGLGVWHPHELRHSAASIMSAAGLPLERVADVLGHDGTRMTALVYRHAVVPTIDGARLMEDVLG